MTTQPTHAETFGPNTCLLDAQAFDNVQIIVDRDAALLAGYDFHGTHIVEVIPSQLTERQRQTLVAVNYRLDRDEVGEPIDGMKSIVELLDLAADKRDRKRAQQQAEDAACIERMIQKFIDAPLSDTVRIDQQTGTVELDRISEVPLVRVCQDLFSVTKTWLDTYSPWEIPATGPSERATANRNAVIEDPRVAERLERAEAHAAQLHAGLHEARAIRVALQDERRVAREAAAFAAKERRKEQLAHFVLTHLSAVDQRKWAANLLPEADIIEALTEQTFVPLDRQFKSVDRSALENDVKTYCFEAFGISSRCAVLFTDRDLETLTNDQFLTLEAINQAVEERYQDHGPAVQPVLLVGYLEDYSGDEDPEYTVPFARVSLTVGEIGMTREYFLDATGAEG